MDAIIWKRKIIKLAKPVYIKESQHAITFYIENMLYKYIVYSKTGELLKYKKAHTYELYSNKKQPKYIEYYDTGEIEYEVYNKIEIYYYKNGNILEFDLIDDKSMTYYTHRYYENGNTESVLYHDDADRFYKGKSSYKEFYENGNIKEIIYSVDDKIRDCNGIPGRTIYEENGDIEKIIRGTLTGHIDY